MKTTNTKQLTLNAVRSNSNAQRLSTVASVLWDLDLDSTPENIKAVRVALTELRLDGLVVLKTVGQDNCYAAR